MKLEFIDSFSESIQVSDSMKTRSMLTNVRADGQTDMTKLNIASRSFASAPLIEVVVPSICVRLRFRKKKNHFFRQLKSEDT